jgi:hypothetical protein
MRMQATTIIAMGSSRPHPTEKDCSDCGKA